MGNLLAVEMVHSVGSAVMIEYLTESLARNANVLIA